MNGIWNLKCEHDQYDHQSLFILGVSECNSLLSQHMLRKFMTKNWKDWITYIHRDRDMNKSVGRYFNNRRRAHDKIKTWLDQDFLSLLSAFINYTIFMLNRFMHDNVVARMVEYKLYKLVGISSPGREH